MSDYNMQQLLIDHTKDISALWESTKSAHKRIDENDHITSGIHKLAANMEGLTIQIKMLTERMDKSIERIETGQKAQGERIGKLEKEPGEKWKDLAKQVVGLVVAAIIGGFISGITT